MEKLSMLYDLNIDYKAIVNYTYLEAIKNNIRTYSMAWQASLLLVDHFKRNTYFYHNNPDCYPLFGNPFSQEHVPDNFIESFVNGEDEKLFGTIITAIKDAMRNDFLKGDKYYCFSFDLLLQGYRRKARRCSFMVFPYLYTPDNKIWVTGYQITASSSPASGNLKIHAINESIWYSFDMETGNFVMEDVIWTLSREEKRILKMSAEGFTEQQIADFLKIKVGMLKNEKVRIFEKMDVNTIYAAISKAFKKGDI